MMRRGELAEYPPADVLRAAASERLTGGIEFDGDPAACVYLDEGEIYLATRADAEVALTVDDELDDTAYEAARVADESRLRAASVEVVADLLRRHDGWYFFHGLTDHPAQGLWGWSVEDLLIDATPADGRREGKGGVDGRAPTRTSSDEGLPLGGPTDVVDRPSGGAGPDGGPVPGAAPNDTVDPAGPAGDGVPRWRLSPTPVADGPDPASWAVVVAMAGAVSEAELMARLGWSTEQARIAIESLTRRGVLVPVTDGPARDGVRHLDPETRPAG